MYDSILSIQNQEKSIFTESHILISKSELLAEHLSLINNSLNVIYSFSIEHNNNDKSELIIQYSGIRMFNSTASSLNLMLMGYYQNSIILIRDILETTFLIDLFSFKPELIIDWADSNDLQLKNKYSPVNIRIELDKCYNNTSSKRKDLYQMFCAYGTHFTIKGTILLADVNNLLQIGPFINTDKLKACIEELCLRVNYASLIFMSHFQKNSNKLLALKTSHLLELEKWFNKYLGV